MNIEGKPIGLPRFTQGFLYAHYRKLSVARDYTIEVVDDVLIIKKTKTIVRFKTTKPRVCMDERQPTENARHTVATYLLFIQCSLISTICDPPRQKQAFVRKIQKMFLTFINSTLKIHSKTFKILIL